LHGNVPGHVELLGDTSVHTGSHDWPSRKIEEAEDPLADLDALVGP
jgi:hypothetical protein